MGKAYTQRVSVNVYSSDRTHMRVALTLLCISYLLTKTAVYCTPLKLCIPKNLCTRNANGSSSEAIYGLCKLNRNNGIMITH